jgi:2-octaprenyl-6-methoxyphenol hydroxylase
MVLVGNAAQTLHPVAGQGFNLGMRDVWTLARTLDGLAADELGSSAALARYRMERGLRRSCGVALTDFRCAGSPMITRLARRARGRAGDVGLIAAGPRWLARKMMFGSRDNTRRNGLDRC